MLAYATVGTNDLEQAGWFYDPLMEELGGTRFMESERMIAWSSSQGAGFGVITPYDGKAAAPGNGAMIAFSCTSAEQVDRLYRMVLENGGSDAGTPGMRGEGRYFAYCRDPDGNKMNLCYFGL